MGYNPSLEFLCLRASASGGLFECFRVFIVPDSCRNLRPVPNQLGTELWMDPRSFYGVMGKLIFNNFFLVTFVLTLCFSVSLQVITLEGWVDIMYYVMDAHSFYNFIYFILLIIVSMTWEILLFLVLGG